MKSLLAGRTFWSDTFRAHCQLCLLILGVAFPVLGDEVRMQNGDAYYGRVLSFNGETLLLQNDNLGTMRVPQGKVSSITFGARPGPGPASSAAATNRLLHAPASLAITNGNSELAKAFRDLSTNSNLVQQVQAQLLGEGGPQAGDKFNELMSGLMSGKMDLNGLLAEAKSTAAQARAARKDLGEDAGAVLDGYLAILDGFIREAEPAGTSTTNSTPARAKPAPGL
ncbi:MAG: hypothetical protein ACREIC_12030 [Limisphaerales bacterium]